MTFGRIVSGETSICHLFMPRSLWCARTLLALGRSGLSARRERTVNPQNRHFAARRERAHIHILPYYPRFQAKWGSSQMPSTAPFSPPSTLGSLEVPDDGDTIPPRRSPRPHPRCCSEARVKADRARREILPFPSRAIVSVAVRHDRAKRGGPISRASLLLVTCPCRVVPARRARESCRDSGLDGYRFNTLSTPSRASPIPAPVG
jgi:hypothetical protein